MSAKPAIVERTFDSGGPRSREAVIARFDEYWERCHPSTTPQSAALVDRIGAAWRAENRAAAAQLVAIGELFGYRLSRCSESEEWAIDTEEAVTAEVAAALRISRGLASTRLRYARAMREQLPKVAEVFTAGEIDYRISSCGTRSRRTIPVHRPCRRRRRSAGSRLLRAVSSSM